MMRVLFALLGSVFLVAGGFAILASFTYAEPNGVLQQAFINSIQIKGILCFIAGGIFCKLVKETA